MLVLPKGVRHMPAYLSRTVQEALVEEVRAIVQRAPLFVPAMPRTGKEMSVRMTNCGPLGWVTDKEQGYRYQPTHPVTGAPWPPIPDALLDLWRRVSSYPHPPEACLINFYTPDAKMGLHQDRDEADFSAPVVSVSLGDDCLFRVGQATRKGATREGATKSFRLQSGDVVVLGGEGRLCFHGVDRIYPSTSALLKNGGRINLTLRRVNP
ncbi:alpha-ketoglutarate-dependent dioxygenase AlkB family protein [Mesorhizobium sp. LjRoot246]|uniref:alpha-ketoglutarate-dependent dioxygenase AlkB family protein n=1 Tax=Mesorhizobium sp. LjRoot246 TaxID=3342294 RepID=UPI003ECDD523